MIEQVGSAARDATRNEYAEESDWSSAERLLDVSNLEMGFKCFVPFNLEPYQSHGERGGLCNILIAPFCSSPLQT